MTGPAENKDMIERVTEIYVAVFPLPVGDDRMTEVILAGYGRDPDRPNRIQIRATVETHLSAVQDLVALCDEIVNEQEEIESYRLLKFDKNGIHGLNPDAFRTFKQVFSHAQYGRC